MSKTDWKSEHPQYTKYTLGDEQLAASPWDLWRDWQAAAQQVMQYANEIALATCGRAHGGRGEAPAQPTVRMVLLKKWSEPEGFFWYSKSDSEKGMQLAENPRAEFLWYAGALQRQVRVRGVVELCPRSDAVSYAKERPRESQISAYVSTQSARVASRKALEDLREQAHKNFAGGEVPVSAAWTGYVLRPEQFEFWQGRADRLHDRILYIARGAWNNPQAGWDVIRLQP